LALELDVAAAMRAITNHSEAFFVIRADVAKAAGAFAARLRSLIAKQIKSSGADLKALQSLQKILGVEAFDIVVNDINDAGIKTLVGKLDKHNAEAKTGTPEWRRRRFRALVNGSVGPKPAPKSAPKAGGVGKSVKPAAPKFLSDPSAGAVRKR
jgi:hypothetical protein